MDTLLKPPPTPAAPPTPVEHPRNALHQALMATPEKQLRLDLLILNAELTQFIDNNQRTNGTLKLHYDEPYTASLITRLTRTTVNNAPAWEVLSRTRGAVTLRAGPWWEPPTY